MAAGRYEELLHRHKGEHILFWKLGVGGKHVRHHQIPLLAHDVPEFQGSLCLRESFPGFLPKGDSGAGHLHRWRHWHGTEEAVAVKSSRDEEGPRNAALHALLVNG